MIKKEKILQVIFDAIDEINEQFEEDAKRYDFYSEDLMAYLSDGGLLENREDVPEWVKSIYVTAPEISPEHHVLMQAAFQTSVDSGISKTINFASEATIEDVGEAYLSAWRTACKGITVYRNGSRNKEVLVNGHRENKQLSLFDLAAVCGCASPMIIQESGCETCKTCGWSACKIA